MTGVSGWRAGIDQVADPQARLLVERLARHIADEDLPAHSLESLEAAAADLRAFAAVRAAGEALVEVRPAALGQPSVVLVATDDMPFLVDSVGIAVRAAGCEVALVMHPQVVVSRDDQGRLAAIDGADVREAAVPGHVAESWMRIELEADCDPDSLPQVRDRVVRALGDVRKAVRDWPAMIGQATAIARELEGAAPAGTTPGDAHAVGEFIDWLADGNFTFLGYREYRLAERAGEDVLLPVPGTGLGILSAPAGSAEDTVSLRFAALPPAVRRKAREPRLLILTKANSMSTVHRQAYLDYVGVKVFDASGTVVGERRFLGLYAGSTYTQSILEVPLLASMYPALLSRLDIVPSSHDGKDLLEFLQTYPRDELLQMSVDQVEPIAASVLSLQGRRHTKVYLRPDDYERFMSCVVYLPRDRYTTAVRQRIEAILREAFGGSRVDYTVLVSDAMLAQVHFVVRVPDAHRLPAVDVHALEARIAKASRGWIEDFAEDLAARVDEDESHRILRAFGTAFPESYKESYAPGRGVHDALVIDQLAPGEFSLETYEPTDGGRRDMRFKVTRIGPALPLSQVLPMLQSLGVEVVDQYPYEVVRPMEEPAWILDFGLLLPDGDIPARGTLAERFEEAFVAAWSGACAVDPFNALIASAGLRWREVLVLRAYSRYLRQLGTAYGQDYVEQVLLGNVPIVRGLMRLFLARFTPGSVDARADEGRAERMAAIVGDLHAALDAVASLDEDRILRAFLALVQGTTRTNYFQASHGDGTGASIAFKIDPSTIPDMPLPKPRFEIWVHSPRVEGVHLRFGSVARGGLRWSDRREDFRTEVLGLVKAQEVKNAVIVPVGAKGGFYPKALPDPTVDRDAWMAEGKAAYREFIGSMLDITDNLQGGTVVPPPDCVRHDGDDPYLVVAADKGTATFSDIANAIAVERGFWLGDAFASGGSAGYDHKAMGITARGAWESVKRHFRELGLDTQAQDFTVAGIGDMSGDVFGNGMLLSKHIRLVVAFDHRHVFVDPDPDAGASFAERARLFALPRSSWDDYDRSLISSGGGVFSRAAKSIDVTPQIADALGIAGGVGSMTPDELIRHALMAPVDLLWNGGIGTYVKSQSQTNADVGDKANDRIRINGSDLRCQVIGEGGNLGLTQLGRVEASRHGVRLNTDAIDNSAGVDTSDHEVNIKILLKSAIEAGALAADERNDLLARMTDDVAAAVLSDNYAQNVVLGNARAGAAALVSVHERMIRELERAGRLNRALEYLPDDQELRSRQAAGQGLTSPELAVLLAYAKITLTEQLNDSDIAGDAYFSRFVADYFPQDLREPFAAQVGTHPLRKEIVSTVATNQLINMGGVTFMFRAAEETGATSPEIVRAAFAAIEIFRLRDFDAQIDSYDNQIPTSAQSALHLEMRRLLDRATRWFLHARGGSIDVEAEIARYAPVVARYSKGIPAMLRGGETERLQRRAERFVAAGAPRELAESAAAALDVFALLDITDIAQRSGEAVDVVLPLYFAVSERYDIDRTLIAITALGREDRWASLARQAMRADLYAVLAGLTSRVLRSTDPGSAAPGRVADWEASRSEGAARARSTLEEIATVEDPDLATLSVALRVLRTLVSQERGAEEGGPQ